MEAILGYLNITESRSVNTLVVSAFFVVMAAAFMVVATILPVQLWSKRANCGISGYLII